MLSSLELLLIAGIKKDTKPFVRWLSLHVCTHYYYYYSVLLIYSTTGVKAPVNPRTISPPIKGKG